MNPQRRLFYPLLVSLFLCLIPAINAQTYAPQPDRFQQERAIIPGASGPNRLPIDSTLLAGSNSNWRLYPERTGNNRKPMIIAGGGLQDLRMYNAANQEVPYLLVMPTAPDSKWMEERPAPLAKTKKTSGFSVDFEKAVLMDRLRLNGVPAPFVKRCILEASTDGNSWFRLRSDATVYDLPSEELRSLEIEFTPGEYRHLKITWDDSASHPVPLPRSVSLRLVSAGTLPPPLVESIAFERRGSEPGISRYRVRLPGAAMPITEIGLSAKGGNLLRQARITEAQLSEGTIIPHQLGTGTLRREVRGTIAAEEMSISISLPKEAQLDLIIEDGNNPPLEITQITAVFAYLPWIYFESPDTSPLVARYGYRGLRAPRYDLEAIRHLAATTRTAKAQWSESRKNSAEAETPSDNGMPEAGSAIDLKSFRYARKIAPGKPGLNALPLDAAVLAHSRLSDIRIALPDGHQVPYLIEKAEELLSLDLPALEKIQDPRARISGTHEQTNNQSVYRLRLPYPNLPPARLVFSTSARVFRRNIQILTERNPYNDRQSPWTRVVAHSDWNNGEPENAAPPTVLEIPSLDTTELLLAVEEGDNSPLPITATQLLLPAYRLRFFRKEGADLSLYYGKSGLPAPQYDLTLLGPRLMGAAEEEISMAPESGAPAPNVRPLSMKLFWGILIAAVLGLLILIVRLIKKAER